MSAIFISKLRTAFYLLDLNKDGALTKEEMFGDYSSRYDSKAKESVPRVLADAWDVLVPSGKLLFDEFLDMHVKASTSNELKKMYEEWYNPLATAQFTAIDENKDGVISKKEYGNHVKKFWNNPNNADEIVRDDFTAIDEDQDGYISLEEFVNWRYKVFLVDDPNENTESCGWMLRQEDWDAYCKSWRK